MANIMEIPYIQPFAKPYVNTPIIRETRAATTSIRNVGSSKFSMIISYNVAGYFNMG